MTWSRELPAEPSSVTIMKDAAGRYFASFVVEIADAGWRLLRTLPESKARLYGGEVKIIGRWEPTSQVCSACGHKDGKKNLAVCAWRCSACGTEHHRDVNAARNILAAGLAEGSNACGAESKTSVLASGTEAGTHLNQGVQPCAA